MGYEERPDLKISGAGSTGGGTFNEVKISGAGKVSGDVDCNVLNTSGASEIKGNVKAVSVKINGASQVRGNLITKELDINGGSTINGNVEAEKLKIHGGSEIDGYLHAGDVEIKGGIKIKGDCEAEDFKSHGGFTIDGLLNADNIEIFTGGFCTVKEIGGEKIEVREASHGMFIINKLIELFTSRGIGLKTDLIEGDDIYLEYTTAKIVRGSRITVGKGCVIDSVEYKETLNIEDDGRVLNKIKVE
jgi:cytoskeletal protein CcmA (bactofilin family)